MQRMKRAMERLGVRHLFGKCLHLRTLVIRDHIRAQAITLRESIHFWLDRRGSSYLIKLASNDRVAFFNRIVKLIRMLFRSLKETCSA
jgi:hypothetical protein